MDNAAFIQEVISSGPRAIIAYVAPWCPNCQRMKPAISEAGRNHRAMIYVANVDSVRPPRGCKIDGVPTFLFYSGGRLVNTIVGATDSFVRQSNAFFS